jgi:hypothetical protein
MPSMPVAEMGLALTALGWSLWRRRHPISPDLTWDDDGQSPSQGGSEDSSGAGERSPGAR